MVKGILRPRPPRSLLGGHEHDGAADEEEQILEEDVVNQVEEAAGETEAGVTALGKGVSTNGNGKNHVAYLTDGRVNEDQLDMVSTHGLPGSQHNGNAANPHDEVGLDDIVESRSSLTEDKEQLAEADDGALQEHGGDVTGNRRGSDRRVHLPVNPDGELGGFHDEADGEQSEAGAQGTALRENASELGSGEHGHGSAAADDAHTDKDEACAGNIEQEVFEGLTDRDPVTFMGEGHIQGPGAHDFPEHEEAEQSLAGSHADKTAAHGREDAVETPLGVALFHVADGVGHIEGAKSRHNDGEGVGQVVKVMSVGNHENAGDGEDSHA